VFRVSLSGSFCKAKILFSLCVCVCALPGKAGSEMTYIVSGGTLNPTRSLTHSATQLEVSSLQCNSRNNQALLSCTG